MATKEEPTSSSESTVVDIVDSAAATSVRPALTFNEPRLPVQTQQVFDAISSSVPKSRVIAQRVLQWMVEIVPGTRAVVLKTAPGGSSATVIAATSSWLEAVGNEIQTDRLPCIAAALAQTRGSCALVNMESDTSKMPWAVSGEREEGIVSCIAMPQIHESAVVVAVASSTNAGPVVSALSAAKAIVTTFETTPNHYAEDPLLVAKMARAKQEWEKTVDALPEIVFLLDERGAVVRANRAVETWGLGRVEAVRGVELHEILHWNCSDPECRVKRILTCRWKQLRSDGAARFKLLDGWTRKMLDISLQAASNGTNDPGPSGPSLTVAVISDVTEIYQAQRALEHLNQVLETRVIERTEALESSNTELRDEMRRREAADHELKRSRDELAQLSEQLIEAQETERRSISLELHDSLGQSLGALKYVLEHAEELHIRGEYELAEKSLQLGIEHLQHAIQDSRSIATRLRPTVLDDMGPVSAIQWMAREFERIYKPVNVIVEPVVENDEIPGAVAPHLFRIVQESLNNVAKHAGASAVLISLVRRESLLYLEIRDDGRGFDVNATRESVGLGLSGMRKRADITGGELSITSGVEIGTNIRIVWDLGTSALEGDSTDGKS